MRTRRWWLIAVDLLVVTYLAGFVAYDIATNQAALAAFSASAGTVWVFNLVHDLVDPR